MKDSRKVFGFISVFILVLFSLSVVFAYAQYETQQTTDVTIPDSGVFHAGEITAVGVTIDVAGTPGATGTVTTVAYSQNPQPDANIPSLVSLTHYVVVTFNIAADDFQEANITIHYTDADVAGISEPYSLYKYIPESNTYILLATIVDTIAKTITATVTSTNDPLFAIGGETIESPPQQINTWLWAIVVIVVLAIVLVAVLVLKRLKLVKPKSPFMEK